MNVRALIVDDEPLARRSVMRFLKNHSEVVIIGECGDGESAVKTIRAENPDLVLLDIQMPEMDGFEVVRQIGPERMPATIFVTAYDHYALRAFDFERSRLFAQARGKEPIRKSPPPRQATHCG